MTLLSACPEGRFRAVVAEYYYVASPTEDVDSTIWRRGVGEAPA